EELDIKVTVDSSGREEYGFLKEQLFQNPNFFHLGAFHEGLAVVKAYNNVYGYVDDKGEIVVDPQYQFASPMSNGRAVVKKFQKWYILNSEFELKPFGAGSLKDMEGATSARPGFLVIQTDGKYHILNTNLQSLELSVPYDSIVYRPQEQVFWCKTDMEEVLYSVAPNQELKVIIRSINIFFDIGLPKQVKYLEEDALSWRLLDLSDIDNPTKSVNKFFGISAFYHQTLAIAETSILTGAGTIYLIDRRGKIVSTFRDTYSVDIFDELLNDKYIIIGVDLSGQKNLVHYFYEKKSAKKLHKKPVYGFAKSGLNQHGHLQVANKRDKWGIIDTAGQQVLDYVSDRPLAYSNATYVATREGKVGAFDIKGQQLTEIKYDRLSGYYNGFYVFTLNAKKGVVNYKSAEIIPPIFAQIKVYKEFFLCSPPTIKGKSSFGIDRRGKCLSGDCEEYKQLLTEYYQKN
ncbi:MAG: WG repeat-containing protein, partial [Bacteroidota bacterium]